LKAGKIQAQGDINLIPHLAFKVSSKATSARFRIAKWRLVVNYLDSLALEFGNIKK
jgi:hypothetical protein